MNYCLDLPNGASIFGQWLYDWQTLISGLLAVGAAYWAGRLIQKQIAQNDDLHRKELSRRHNAARAVLPLALSEISEFCQKIADNVADEIEARSKEGYIDWTTALDSEDSPKQLTSQDFPESTISTFQAFIETLTNKENIRHVADLISSLQILNARYTNLNLNQIGVVRNLYGLLIDTAKVKLLNDSIFNYGHFVDESPFSVIGTTTNPEAWDMIKTKAHSLIFSRKIPDLFFYEITELISRDKANNNSPWLEKFEYD